MSVTLAYELCSRLIEPNSLDSVDLSCWKVAFNGSEKVRESTLNRFTEKFSGLGFQRQALRPAYGLAEATLMVTIRHPQDPLSILRIDENALARGHAQLQPEGLPIVSCGRVCGDQMLTIHDSCGEVVPEGSVGEIRLLGDCVSPGYWGEPPRRVGIPLATGDLGFLYNREVYVVGRLKDRIIMNGVNHYPEDIEHLLLEGFPEFRPGEICAFDVPGPHSDQLAIVVEKRRPDPQLPSLLRKYLATRVDLPIHHLFVVGPGAIPKTTSGKFSRHRCRQEWLRKDWKADSLQSDSAAYGGEDSPLACLIQTTIERLSQVVWNQRSWLQDFASLGLDSVQRLELVGELARHLGKNLAGDLSWIHQTPQALYQALQASNTHSQDLQILRSGATPPLIVVHGIGGDVHWAQEVVAHFEGVQVLGLRRVSPAGTPLTYQALEEVAATQASRILSNHPGPYRLLGYSYGCRTTFALAVRLAELGHPPDFVGLIDGYPHHQFDLPLTQLFLQIFPWLRQWWRQSRKRGWNAALRANRSTLNWLGRYLAVLGGRLDPVRFGREQLHSTSRPHMEVAYRFRPAPADLRVHVFRSRGPRLSVLRQPGAGWAPYARGGVEVVEVPGNHITLLREPNARPLARKIQQCLRAIEGGLPANS